jgi:hypothetical protein
MRYELNDDNVLIGYTVANVDPAHWAYAKEDDAAEAAWNAMTPEEQDAKVQADIAALYA